MANESKRKAKRAKSLLPPKEPKLSLVSVAHNSENSQSGVDIHKLKSKVKMAKVSRSEAYKEIQRHANYGSRFS